MITLIAGYVCHAAYDATDARGGKLLISVRLQNEQPIAIGAFDLAIFHMQEDAGMTQRATVAIALYLALRCMNDVGSGFALAGFR